ncbi:Serine aminopeptidase-like protein 3 [Elsinoe fawcettii]|nr:Serine aminopeptidase-like protein 3 [Elsinoe fawcettii]
MATSTVTESEGKHTLQDGLQLYTKTYLASPETARLLFLHGFSDHSGNYTDLHPYLASRGISVYSFDQRGWGRSVPSPSHRGLTGPTPQVMADITSLLRTLLPSPVPVFLMGHSMGGAEALFYTSTDPDSLVSQLRGTVALAPLIALHPRTRPNIVTVTLGRLAGRFLPSRKMVNKLDPTLLSRVETKNLEWANDPLNHDTGTLEGLAGMLDRGMLLETGQVTLGKGKHEGGRSRVLVVHGTGDEINDVKGSRDWVEKSEAEDKRFWELDGWYHNLHVEPEKEMFRKEVAEWILERAKGEQARL